MDFGAVGPAVVLACLPGLGAIGVNRSDNETDHLCARFTLLARVDFRSLVLMARLPRLVGFGLWAVLIATRLASVFRLTRIGVATIGSVAQLAVLSRLAGIDLRAIRPSLFWARLTGLSRIEVRVGFPSGGEPGVREVNRELIGINFGKVDTFFSSPSNHDVADVIHAEDVAAVMRFPVVEFDQTEGCDRALLGDESEELKAATGVEPYIRLNGLV